MTGGEKALSAASLVGGGEQEHKGRVCGQPTLLPPPPWMLTYGRGAGRVRRPGDDAKDRKPGGRRIWPLTRKKRSLSESLPVQVSVSSSVQWG